MEDFGGNDCPWRYFSRVKKGSSAGGQEGGSSGMKGLMKDPSNQHVEAVGRQGKLRGG